jgi:hypothetical protein
MSREAQSEFSCRLIACGTMNTNATRVCVDETQLIKTELLVECVQAGSRSWGWNAGHVELICGVRPRSSQAADALFGFSHRVAVADISPVYRVPEAARNRIRGRFQCFALLLLLFKIHLQNTCCWCSPVSRLPSPASHPSITSLGLHARQSPCASANHPPDSSVLFFSKPRTQPPSRQHSHHSEGPATTLRILRHNIYRTYPSPIPQPAVRRCCNGPG